MTVYGLWSGLTMVFGHGSNESLGWITYLNGSGGHESWPSDPTVIDVFSAFIGRQKPQWCCHASALFVVAVARSEFEAPQLSELSPPSILPRLGRSCPKFLNVVVPWLVYVYEIWSRVVKTRTIHVFPKINFAYPIDYTIYKGWTLWLNTVASNWQ